MTSATSHLTSFAQSMAFLAALSAIIVTGSLIIESPAAAGQIFYVSPAGNDANPGTQENAPWKTIGKAARTLLAGDTALLMDGTYTEPEIQFRNSGTATAPIIVRARNKHRAILSSTSGCRANIGVYGSYVTIEGLRSSIAPSNVPCASHNSSDGTGVRCWPDLSGSKRVSCTIRGMLFDASPARSHAVKVSQDYTIVEDCVANSGLEAFNGYGIIFRNNVIIGGDAWGASLVAKGGVRSFKAYNNLIRIRSVGGTGIVLGGSTGSQWLYDPSSGIEAYNSVAYNNVVINESGGATLSLGMKGARNSMLSNNVVVAGSLFLLPGRSGTLSANPTIKNNILSCSGQLALAHWKYSGTMSLDYNDFYNCPGAPSQIHPVVGDPLFINPRSDWHLASGSPAIQSGTTVTVTGFNAETILVNRDRDNKVRSTPWGLGIYAANPLSSSTAPLAAPSGIRVP